MRWEKAESCGIDEISGQTKKPYVARDGGTALTSHQERPCECMYIRELRNALGLGWHYVCMTAIYYYTYCIVH
jgi:hypothetical protein